jgi:hypothetical protein
VSCRDGGGSARCRRNLVCHWPAHSYPQVAPRPLLPATALGSQFGPLSSPSRPTLSVNPAVRRPSSKQPPPPSSPSSAVGASESSMSPLAPLRAARPSRCAQTWCTIAAPYASDKTFTVVRTCRTHRARHSQYASDKTFTVVRTCAAQGGAAAGRHPLHTPHALRRRGRGARGAGRARGRAASRRRSVHLVRGEGRDVSSQYGRGGGAHAVEQPVDGEDHA